MLRRRTNRAQTFMEYTILIGIVVTFLMAMSPILKRGVQGVVKILADQVGRQNESDQQDAIHGYMSSAHIDSSMARDIQRQDRLGNTTYVYQRDDTITSSEQYSNLGYQDSN